MARRRALLITTAALGAALCLMPALAADDAKTVGMSTCGTCHEDVATAFAKGAHGTAMAARSKDVLERSCESCHGPGAAHADDPNTSNIVRDVKPEACLSCHTQISAFSTLANEEHPRQGVACLDCHAAAHTAPEADHLLKKAPAQLCASCHREQAAQFLLPSAHREGQAPFDCTRCHTVHGLGRQGANLLKGKAAVCLDCHTEKAGPYVFPHPPREADACLGCHRPHGSANPKLLVRRNGSSLCLECHTSVPAFHDLSKARYRTCTNCHVAVHGSNHDSRLFED